MNNLLKILYVLIVFCCWSTTHSYCQQTGLSSFYQYNWQLQNPAAFDRIYIYDKHKNVMLNATYRNQWAWSGIDDAPVNYSLSFENIVAPPGCRNCQRVKWGFNAYNDVTGAIRNTGIYGNFSYYIPVFDGRDKWLHFGISPGLVSYGINGSKVNFKNSADNSNYSRNQVYGDFSFGIFYRHQKKFYFGLSVPQTFSFGVANLGNSFGDNIAKERLQHVYMVIGGFMNSRKKRRSDNNITVEPSLWLRYVPGITFNTLTDNLPISSDFSVRAYYNSSRYSSGAPLFWVGAGYGTNRNLKLEVGITPLLFSMYGDEVGPDRLRFGIAWEMPVGTRGINLGQSLELNFVYAWNY